jgi:hypothetical protein
LHPESTTLVHRISRILIDLELFPLAPCGRGNNFGARNEYQKFRVRGENRMNIMLPLTIFLTLENKFSRVEKFPLPQGARGKVRESLFLFVLK